MHIPVSLKVFSMKNDALQDDKPNVNDSKKYTNIYNINNRKRCNTT